MKKPDVGQMITIIANVGVIGGILLLAYELRQNNDLLEAQAREALLDRRTDAYALVASNGDLAAILSKRASDQPLTQAESIQLSAYNRRVLASFEWQFGEYQRGRPILRRYSDRRAACPISRPIIHTWALGQWRRWKEQTTPEFVEFVEQNAIDVGE